MSSLTKTNDENDRETSVGVNIETLELLGIDTSNFIIVGDELISLSDGTLIKAGL